MLAKFACANLEANFSSVCYLIKFLRSNIFSMIMISNFLFNFINFYDIVSFLTKSLILLTFFNQFNISSIFNNVIFYLQYLVYSNQLDFFLIFQCLIYLFYFLNCLKHLVHFLIYQFNFSTSTFKSAKSVFLAKSDVSTPIAFFKSYFFA